jgi:CDGSH-type Zn-finger protein
MDQARITAYRDGPLIVRGAFLLEDQEGNPIDAGRETIALCRCGKSRAKPFCDGTHRLARFKAPSAPDLPAIAPALAAPTAEPSTALVLVAPSV